MADSPPPQEHAPETAFPGETLPPGVSGAAGQATGDEIDYVIPSHGHDTLRLVGLGGSAGSLRALQEFFSGMPDEPGMAFVVIVHLSPDHESTMSDLLQRWTAMPVHQVNETVMVELNHVYIIPPGKNLTVTNGHLRLSEPPPRRGRHVSVDLFFRTLADTHGLHAAAVILSGADSDGALGIKRIKERGGLTIAQDPSEAEHDSMPRAAVATGMVDWVLPVAEMPRRIIQYWETERQIQLPMETDSPPAREIAPPGDKAPADQREAALREIVNFLRVRTGRDFSYYKRPTILRRIGRRMQVNGIAEPAEYLAFLRTIPGESVALLQDLLISVTNFFRDREAFDALETAIPHLFEGKGPNDYVRVWVPACATGEEAYSIAMLLSEYAGSLDAPPSFQIFATDLDEGAIQTGREALYPETISADVSEERLRRFFSRTQGGYRVKRELREIVLFAIHDLLKDSPFSRLDMVSCRNLLIYLNREAQSAALQIFHFALLPRGRLFLGVSDSVDEGNTLFAVVNKKYRLYSPRSFPRQGLPMPQRPSSLMLTARRHALEKPVIARAPVAEGAPRGGPVLPLQSALTATADHLSWGERHFKLIERFGPPSLIVNADHDIIHLSEHAGRFLQLVGGEPTTNLLRIVHPMLRVDLRSALFRARQGGEPVDVRDIPLEIDGKPRTIDLHVVPEQILGPELFLVVFDEKASTAESPAATSAEREPVATHLEQELEQVKRELRDNVEQSEAASEELKASNEELQAMNEELRSATEELETSREELQSINEELTTVNQELKSKVDQLARSNSDLQNLMASTAIATIFLTRDLRIGRYTAAAISLFNLIATDIGRPLSDLSHRIDYPNLVEDAKRVLETLAPVEREVGHSDGRRFLTRILPYRTTDDHIAGTVLTFVDITEARRAEEAQRASETRFQAVANLVPDLLWSADRNGQWTWCNQRWMQYTGLTIEQSRGFGWLNAVHPEDREATRQAFETMASRETLQHEHRLRGADGVASWFLIRAEPVQSASPEGGRWFGAATNIDDYKRSQAALAASEEHLRLVLDNAREFAIFSMDVSHRITSWHQGAQNLLGYSEAEIIGKPADIIFTEEDRAEGTPKAEAEQALAEGRATREGWRQRKDGSLFWGSGAMMAMHDGAGKAIGLVKILRDETAEQNAREALEKSRQELIAALQTAEQARAEAEAAGQAKDRFLAVLSHELRTPLTPVLMGVRILQLNRDLPPKATEALEMITRNVQIEARFIDDLLDVSRLRHGKLEIAREPVDIHGVIRSAIEVSQSEIEAKRQVINVWLEASNHQCVGDSMRLQQVFWNLVKNAAKFTDEEGRICVSSRDARGMVIVEISDSGAGIRPDSLDRIFEPFAQETGSSPRKTGGLGLGLAIAKAIAQAHGGDITAASAGLNQGATFTVTLPTAGQSGQAPVVH
jgi:two-component system CheB/CheR fusion protein